jgi:hypothetical protein
MSRVGSLSTSTSNNTAITNSIRNQAVKYYYGAGKALGELAMAVIEHDNPSGYLNDRYIPITSIADYDIVDADADIFTDDTVHPLKPRAVGDILTVDIVDQTIRALF